VTHLCLAPLFLVAGSRVPVTPRDRELLAAASGAARDGRPPQIVDHRPGAPASADSRRASKRLLAPARGAA